MLSFILLGCADPICPSGRIQAPDGSCISNQPPGSDTSISEITDSGNDDDTIAWQTLPENCTANTGDTNPIFQVGALFAQEYVFAEIIDAEVDIDHNALWTVGESGLMAFDVSTPNNPIFTTAVYPDGWDHRFYQLSLGTYPALYASHRDHGIAVYSRADVNAPELTTTIEEPNLGGITVVGDRLYATNHTGALHTYDVSYPLAPEPLNMTTYSGSPWKPLRNGNHLYLADNQKGIVVFSIHDTDAPLYLGHSDAVGGVQDIALSQDGSILYAAVGSRGVEVFSLENPEQPQSLGHHPLHHSAISLDVGGNNLWVTNQQDVVLFDVSTPSLPIIMGTQQTEQWAMTVSATETHAFVGDWGYVRVFVRLDGADSADLDLSTQMLQLPTQSQIRVGVRNFGSLPLELQGATSTTPELKIDVSAAQIAPGELGWIRLTTDSGFINGQVCIASNDPDEPVQTIKVTATGVEGTQLGTLAPDFTLTALDGQTVTLSEQIGNPVVLSYFATW